MPTLSSGRPQWRGSDNLLRSPGSGARHSPAHRLDAVGAEGRSRCVRRRRGAREGLSPLSARGVGHAPAAAQPSRKSQPSSPDANPVQEVAGTVVWHGWVPLGPTERPPGARQTCFWALFQRSRPNHSYNEPRGVYLCIPCSGRVRVHCISCTVVCRHFSVSECMYSCSARAATVCTC